MSRFVDVWVVEVVRWVDADMLIEACSSYERMVAYQHRRGMSVLPRPPLIPYLIHCTHNISIELRTTTAIDLARGLRRPQLESRVDQYSNDQNFKIYSPKRI